MSIPVICPKCNTLNFIDLNYEEVVCSKCGYTPGKKVERKSNEASDAIQMRLLREVDAVDGINETSRKAA